MDCGDAFWKEKFSICSEINSMRPNMNIDVSLCLCWTGSGGDADQSGSCVCAVTSLCVSVGQVLVETLISLGAVSVR